MNKILKIVLGLIGLALLGMGVMWLVSPADAAKELGMPLLEGRGLSTQIGDLAAFFTASGVLILIGLMTGKRHWLYGPAMLLGLTAAFRIIAWAAHGAAFATDAIVVEVVTTSLLLFAASRIQPAE